MNREDIIRMAREADPGFDGGQNAMELLSNSIVGIAAIERFAALVAAQEREECAKFCDDQYEFYGFDHVFAAGIRARGKE